MAVAWLLDVMERNPSLPLRSARTSSELCLLRLTARPCFLSCLASQPAVRSPCPLPWRSVALLLAHGRAPSPWPRLALLHGRAPPCSLLLWLVSLSLCSPARVPLSACRVRPSVPACRGFLPCALLVAPSAMVATSASRASPVIPARSVPGSSSSAFLPAPGRSSAARPWPPSSFLLAPTSLHGCRAEVPSPQVPSCARPARGAPLPWPLLPCAQPLLSLCAREARARPCAAGLTWISPMASICPSCRRLARTRPVYFPRSAYSLAGGRTSHSWCPARTSRHSSFSCATKKLEQVVNRHPRLR